MNRSESQMISAPPAGAPNTGSPPLVTVVICVYNAGAYLRPAVQSVLDQTYRHTEILIIDDGSTDGCMDTIADLDDPRIRRFAQPNAGKPAALNRAIELARGKYFLLNDADDLSHPRRIERMVAAMEAEPELGAVFSGYELLIDDRHVAPRFAAKDIEACRREVEAFRMPSHDPTALFRMSVIRDLRYDPELKLGEGLDFILQVGERAPLRVLGECLYSYRVHPASLTAVAENEKLAYARRVVERARRRRGLEPLDTARDAVPGARAHRRSRRQTLVAHFMESVLDQRAAGRFGSAVRTGLECARLAPWNPYYYRALVYALVPRALVRAYRGLKRR